MTQQTIPVVDLTDYLEGSNAKREKFIQEMGDALKDFGFFALQNHGVDYRLIQQAYKMAEGFFDLPESTKKKYGLTLEVLFCDATALKTIERANPSFVILNYGTVKQKVHYNDSNDLNL